MDIIKMITMHKNDFSKTEDRVANFIVKQPQIIETATISKVAAMCETSTSAVLRFCQVLGFQGYKDFRFEMIKYLHEHVDNKDNNDVISLFTNEYLKVVSQMQNIDRQIIDILVKQIKTNSRVYIIGIYYSSLPSRHLKAGLQDLGIIANTGYDYMEAAHLINNIDEDDLLIYFSISGSTSGFNQFLSLLKTNNTNNSYLITLNPNNQLKKYFNQTLVLPGQSITKQSVIDCQSIIMIFVEMLLNILHQSY